MFRHEFHGTSRAFLLPACIALLAAACASLLAIFGNLTPDQLASGLLLASAPVAVPDFKAVLAQIAQGVEDMKTKHAADLASLRRDIEHMEVKGNLQGLMGAGGQRVASPSATDAEHKAFRNFICTGEKSQLLLAGGQQKAMNVGTGNDGGYAVPTWFDAQVHSVMRDATPLLDLVTHNANLTNFPARHLVATGGAGFGWAGETLARGETNSPKIEKVDISGLDLWANPFATQWALDDVNFNAEAWLAQEIGLTMAMAIQSNICSGPAGGGGVDGFLSAPQSTTTDSGGRPFGTVQVMNTGNAGGLPATTAALIDLLLNVVHSLKQQYRQGASWLMNSTTLAAVRMAKDTTNRPVLIDSLVSGQPATLLGYPVYEVADMPTIAASALPIAFGNYKRGYVLDEHMAGLRILVDPYSSKPYVGFYALRRMGGGVLDSSAIKLIKCAA